MDKVKRIMEKLAAQPYNSALFFLGPSGTGKTTMELALAAEMPAEIHHVASQECTLDSVRELARICHYCPRMFSDWQACKMHVCVIDEADQMTQPAQLAFLILLDATGFPPNTVFIFTGNSTANLEARFLSRCQVLDFSSYGIAKETADLLSRIWDAETDQPADRPNFQRIVKDACNNVRESLMRLQTEIMAS
jgi:replication-associated recombination protein RarA